MTVGDCIKAARKKAGLTQAELAAKLSISAVGVSQWENNLRNPKFETLRKIADALNISVYDLFGENERELFTEGEANALLHGLGKKYSFSEPEQALVIAFDQLNDDGQQKAVERVEELTEIPKYQREK